MLFCYNEFENGIDIEASPLTDFDIDATDLVIGDGDRMTSKASGDFINYFGR